MTGLLIVLAALAVVAALPFAIERRKPSIETARESAPGRFVRLSQGVTHYRWHGPEGRPVVVCVHGLTTPSFVWDGVARGLVRMGYSVLVYDLYGRGYSDRPPGPQTRAFFLRQLTDLLESQGIEDDMTMFGFSMGGAIAACFAAEHAARLRRLVLIAPAGVQHTPAPDQRLMRDLPGIGDWLALTLYPRRLRIGAARLRQAHGIAPGDARAQGAQAAWRGFVPAVLASLRGLLSETLQTEHRRIAEEEVPVLAIWGTADAVIPLAGMGELARWNRAARQSQIEGATHGLPLTHADDILAAFRAATVAR